MGEYSTLSQLEENQSHYEEWIRELGVVSPASDHLMKLKKIPLFHVLKTLPDEQTLINFKNVLEMKKLISKKKLLSMGIFAESLGGTLSFDESFSRNEFVYFSSHFLQKSFSEMIVFTGSCQSIVGNVIYPDAFFCNDIAMYTNLMSSKTDLDSYKKSMLKVENGVDIVARIIEVTYPNLAEFNVFDPLPYIPASLPFYGMDGWFNPEVAVKNEVLLNDEIRILITGKSDFTNQAGIIARRYGINPLIFNKREDMVNWYRNILVED
ncbi:hypothetical protein JI735_19430 [Paenibacillus sonchi]|uniref:Uncharacterized protein n=1 Tax=Paenibacillus sonchi TaxID=373687 RepID=A0A974P7S2_9BACL|nr:hypothetical protein [Paenibacillus sonchi]QQZ58905.1 hypothetical protein JI735_19430 [Paenibacillus sonchi]